MSPPELFFIAVSFLVILFRFGEQWRVSVETAIINAVIHSFALHGNRRLVNGQLARQPRPTGKPNRAQRRSEAKRNRRK